MIDPPRVAFITDTFHQVNGAARSCRELQAYARRKQYPFCCIRFGKNPGYHVEGSIRTLELRQSPLSVPVDTDLMFDPLFYRYRRLVENTLRDFKPDLVHIISMGDAGILGAIAADVLRVPLVLSWHTNVHEFAARRVGKMLRWLPKAIGGRAEDVVERFVLDRNLWYYGRGHVLMAPSPELVELLRKRTGRPAFYMGRGVDTRQFSPNHRDRDDDVFTIGFVGRLMPEKNVRFFAALERAMESAGCDRFRIVFVGEGRERNWLTANIKRATLTGVLHGEDLGRTYANFDVFAFPSRTDTFGQVVQEALSSGVPAVVTNSGGPQFIVDHGETGLVARDDREFTQHIIRLKEDAGLRHRLGVAARRRCYLYCWDRIFLEVYKAYQLCKIPALAHPRTAHWGRSAGLAALRQQP